MKILIFYTPRSKSTMLHDMICKRYGLSEFSDRLTKSRIKNGHLDEYSSLIKHINSNNNICVKINGNDFVDMENKKISNYYKDIDYLQFDKVIFLTRQNYIDAILSYGYMDPSNSDTWHKKTGQEIKSREYTITDNKIFHLLRGYVVFDLIKGYIRSMINNDIILDYDFENVDDLLKKLDLNVVNIDLEPLNIDYRKIVTNYDKVLSKSFDFLSYHTDINSEKFWQ